MCSRRIPRTAPKLLLAMVACVLGIAVPGIAPASTTIEEQGHCRYADADGNRVFDGGCRINWGVGPAKGCPKAEFSERYILSFGRASEIVVFLLCDETATANGIAATFAQGALGGQPAIRILTSDGEIIEFTQVGE